MPVSNSARVSTRGLSQSPALQGLSQPRKLLWRVHVQSCLRRHIDCAITVDEFFTLALQDCHYCGMPPVNFLKQYPDFHYNGIDRVENDLPYALGNLVPCCKTCNSMKSSLPAKVFLAHVARISRHQAKKL